MYDYPESDESKQISKYNEASLQIMRLNEYWIKAANYSQRRQFAKWKFVLDTIYMELVADIYRSTSKEDYIKRDVELKKSIAAAKTIAQIYNALQERHTFLKMIQDDSGKGTSLVYANNEDMI